MGISWARSPGERGNGMAQMILGMMTVGASDDIFRCAKDASDVIDGYVEL